MNLVDSSGWLEYLSDGPNASSFETALTNPENLIVPTLCLYEVFKVVLRQRGETDALQAAALMSQGNIIELTSEIALQAARISLDHKLPMADSLILATARAYRATLWTQDEHFEGMEGVKYVEKVFGGRA